MCVFFLLSSLFRLSSVSVVFDFNASLNDAASVSPNSLPVDVMRKGGKVICVTSFVFFFALTF